MSVSFLMSDRWRRAARVLCVALMPMGLLAACGGGDTEDRLNLNDPNVRFVHAARLAADVAPDVTLYRGTTAQSDATDVGFGFISDYFDVSTSAADWSVHTSTGDVTLDTVKGFDPSRGNLYTFFAVADGAADVKLVVVRDPYNKSLLSNEARVRVFNAASNADALDVYMTRSGDSVASSDPVVSGVKLDEAGPVSGDNSKSIDSGRWTLSLTTAGRETVRFSSSVSLDDNDDVLFVVVNEPDSDTGLRVLMKVDNDDPVELTSDD